jgi:hypothetical protein
MDLFEKMRERRWRKKLMKGQYELTISGKYFINYCKKIADGVWVEKDYIEAYDEELMRMVSRYNVLRPDHLVSRENMAKVLVMFVGNKG